MNSLYQDVRFSLRKILKRPGFSLLVVLTLALGIGANTAIFSVVHGLMFRTLPVPDADNWYPSSSGTAPSDSTCRSPFRTTVTTET